MGEAISLLRDVLAAVRITSPTSYSWLGSPSFRLPRSDARMLPPDIAHAELVAALTDQLYRDFYTVGRVEPIDPSRVVVLHSTGASAFTHSLEAAAAGVVRHTGWTVEGIWRNRVVITRDGLRVWARPDRTTCDGEPVPGRSASLLVAARSTTVSPGFVTVFGRDGQGCSDVAGTVRLYWNLRYRAAARFLGLLRAELDRAGVAFLVKALLDVSGYGLRRDTAVLYLTATDFTRAGPVLRTVVDRLADGLRPGVPAFTKELARGLGVAECPEGVASFGQTRCRALAESLVDDHRTQPRASADARLTAVITHLVAAGVRPDAPHLNPGSTADYQLPELARTRRRRRAVPPCSSASVIGSVARQLCDEAVWHDGRCNWVGAVSADSAPVGAFGALGPDVYDGTSGIALFLAEAAAVLDDKRVMRTAIGAARQALAVTTAADPDWMSTGFYRGTTGVAFAAARVGVLSGLVELVDRAVRVVADHDDWGESSDVNDLFAGHAGRIVGLLALARMMGDDDLLRRAARAGDRLLDRAERTRRSGWYWSSPAAPRSAGLTGFAHGAAGVAHAFVELYGATAESRYRHAALQAFAQENRWFSPTELNWLDLRFGRPSRSTTPKVFRRVWCHGAAGIALSRIRAHEVLGDPGLLSDARAGLTTTLRDVKVALVEASDDYSLCHGTAGQAAVLLLGRDVARESAQEVLGVVQAVAKAASPCADGKRAWASVAQASQEKPGLFLGPTGIGYLHLRLLHPEGPASVLLPGPSVDRRPR